MNENRTRGELLDLLAGRLSEEERERLEDRLLIDDDLFDELAGAEDDLVDAFVRGDLETRDERVLERLVVASERVRESAELGAALSAYPAWRRASGATRAVEEALPPRRSPRWQRRALIGLLAVVVVLLLALSVRQSRSHDAL